jgi:hypothetical protein
LRRNCSARKSQRYGERFSTVLSQDSQQDRYLACPKVRSNRGGNQPLRARDEAGSPEAQGRSRLSEKRKFHVGVRAGNYNMYMATLRMLPTNWGIGVVDGFEGMEGNGPGQGTPPTPPHRIALASTGLLAVDRVSLECMGIDASWPGYLNYAYQAGLGQYDLAKIDVVGVKIADVQRKCRLHADTDITRPKQNRRRSSMKRASIGASAADSRQADGFNSTGAAFSRTFKGVAPNVNLISLKVLDQNGSGQESDVIAARTSQKGRTPGKRRCE